MCGSSGTVHPPTGGFLFGDRRHLHDAGRHTVFRQVGPDRGGGLPSSELWVWPAFAIFVTLCALFMYYQHKGGRPEKPAAPSQATPLTVPLFARVSWAHDLETESPLVSIQSDRTALALTLLCVWLGREVSVARQRREARERIESSGGKLMSGLGGNIILRRDRQSREGVSWVRRMVGDNTVGVVWFPRTLQTTILRWQPPSPRLRSTIRRRSTRSRNPDEVFWEIPRFKVIH